MMEILTLEMGVMNFVSLKPVEMVHFKLDCENNVMMEIR